jgi:YbbR domain-containing protein
MILHKLESIFSHRVTKWVFLIVLAGFCLVLLWPDATLIETNIFIPIDIVKIPSGLTTGKPPEKGLDVRVRGPETVIEKLPDLKIRYSIDLSGANVGMSSIPIDSNLIPLPRKISIIRITPANLTVNLEHAMEKKVPVMVSVSGTPVSGFFVADAIAKPSFVTLRGPENVLGPIENANTKPIDVSGLSEPFKKEIALDLAEGLDIASPLEIVLAEILIEEQIVTKIFRDIPVDGKDTPYRYTITPPSIDIEVKGPANILEKLYSKNGIKVYVDLKALEPGVYEKYAAITLPVKTALLGVNPEIFAVKISSQIQKNNNKQKTRME